MRRAFTLTAGCGVWFPKPGCASSILAEGAKSLSGCSLAAKAPVLGTGNRSFDYCHPDQFCPVRSLVGRLFYTQVVGGSIPSLGTISRVSLSGRALARHASSDRFDSCRAHQLGAKMGSTSLQSQRARRRTVVRVHLAPPCPKHLTSLCSFHTSAAVKARRINELCVFVHSCWVLR